MNEFQVCNKMADRHKHGLSQLDHSDSESAVTDIDAPWAILHPRGVIILWLHPRAITPSLCSRLSAGCLCQLDPSSGDLIITYFMLLRTVMLFSGVVGTQCTI